jgi:hypothetical protein
MCWRSAAAGALIAGLAVGGTTVGMPKQDETASVEARATLPDGSVAALLMRLEVHDGTALVFSARTDADSTGMARWDEVPASPGMHATVSADYDGVTYRSDTAVIRPGSVLQVSLAVFPVTGKGNPLHIDTLHVILQADEPTVYRVLQFMTVSNAGLAAYAGGPLLSDGRPAGLVIPLPDRASAVSPAPFPSPEDALPPSDADIGPGRVLDARPVPPTGRQVAVTYSLTADDHGMPFHLDLPYPVQSASVMMGGDAVAGLELTTSTLQEGEPQDIGGQLYKLWTAEALSPGSELSFELRTPGVRLLAKHWALIGLTLAMMVAVAASVHGGGSIQHARQRHSGLIDRIVRLDLLHEQGGIADIEYFRERARELEDLQLLEQQTKSARATRSKP